MRLLVCVVTVLSAASLAHAQAKIVPADAAKAAGEDDVEGWNTNLGLTSTLTLTSNENVIGQVNGWTTMFSLGVLAGAEFIQDEHLFRSTLAINEGFSRTPVVDRFVKSTDAVKLDGIYNYFVTKQMGAYARLNFNTSVFRTFDIRGTPTNWVDITDMMPTPLATNAFSQRLSGAYAPLTFGESVGGFYDPVRKEEINASLRLGAAGRHTFADGVLVAKDNAMTPEIELLRLSDVHQVGAEAFAGVDGKLQKGKLNYKAGIAVLLPIINNDKYDRSMTKLTRVGLEANLTYALSSFLSVVYTLAITRDPQLFPLGQELVQVQNTLLVTFQLNLVKKKEKPKAKTELELELEATKLRADEAERRATEAEQKLQELQPKP